jgi:hypothetical protein
MREDSAGASGTGRPQTPPGWDLQEAGTHGWFRWTMPSGRTYLMGIWQATACGARALELSGPAIYPA